jgi:hypothetical protein
MDWIGKLNETKLNQTKLNQTFPCTEKNTVYPLHELDIFPQHMLCAVE